MRAPLLLALGLAVLLAGCGGDDGAPQDENVDRQHVGDVLVDRQIEGAGDYRVRTSEFGSRVLLIHLFDASSEECRAQVRQIKSLWFPRRAAGMTVLGICPETERHAVLGVMARWGIPYPVFVDPKREFTRELAPRKYPWNVVVGRDGTILLSEKGSWDRVQSAVEEALRARVAGPDHVRVQHLLVAFEGSVPGKAERTKQEAAKLADEVFERAKAGEDFDQLVRKYTSDAVPGVYHLANYNIEIDDDIEESERGNVVQSFGDVAFALDVGEIGMAEYHSIKCPYGWHIIKRLD